MAIQKIQITSSGGTVIVADSSIFSSYYVYTAAAVTLSSSFSVDMNTPRNGLRIRFEYNPGTVTLGGNHITFMRTQMPDDYASKKVNVDCYFNGSVWTVDYTPAFQEADIITSSHIKNVAVSKITGTASKLMEFTAGGIGQASATTAAEAGFLAGVVAGTVTADKVIVPTTGKVIDEIDITTLKIGSTAVTASAAELNILDGVTADKNEINVLDGVTAGTVTASKAVVVDSSSKVDSWDATVLKINGQTVAATGTELSELNGAGVVHLDFHKIAGLDAAGVTAADLALLAGAAAATPAVTAADIQGIATDAPKRVQPKTAAVITDQAIDNATGVIILTLTADTSLTLPDGSTNSKQAIDIIVIANAASAYDVTFTDTGSTFYYAGTSASDTMTVATPAPGTIIKLSNYDTNKWAIGKI